MSLIERPISEYRAYSGECSAAGLNDAAYALLDAASTLEAQQAEIAELRRDLLEVCIVRHKHKGTVICGRNNVETYLRLDYVFDWKATGEARSNHIQGDGE